MSRCTWPWPLTSCPWTFTALPVSCGVKLCTKFERNWIIHGWVIDDLARFRRTILGGGELLPSGCQGCADATSPNLASAYRAIMTTQNICFRVRIYCCILIAGGSNLSDVENDANFRTFWPPPPFVKIGGWVGEISCWIEVLPTTKPSEFIWWPSTARLLSAVDW